MTINFHSPASGLQSPAWSLSRPCEKAHALAGRLTQVAELVELVVLKQANEYFSLVGIGAIVQMPAVLGDGPLPIDLPRGELARFEVPAQDVEGNVTRRVAIGEEEGDSGRTNLAELGELPVLDGADRFAGRV